jgi:hypothetical protein
MENRARLLHSCPVTPPLIDADSGSGVAESAAGALSTPGIASRAGSVVSGRIGQLACAVAVAPFAILTVLFLGNEPV